MSGTYAVLAWTLPIERRRRLRLSSATAVRLSYLLRHIIRAEVLGSVALDFEVFATEGGLVALIVGIELLAGGRGREVVSDSTVVEASPVSDFFFLVILHNDGSGTGETFTGVLCSELRCSCPGVFCPTAEKDTAATRSFFYVRSRVKLTR